MDLVLLGLAVLLLVFALPTFPWILGGRDPDATCVNAAVQMRATHSTGASYPRLREVPRAVLPRLSLWEPDPIKGQERLPPPPADPYERDAWPGMYLSARIASCRRATTCFPPRWRRAPP